jgi:hypothetical protein
MKVDCLDFVSLQDRQEERREGRYHSSEDKEEEEGLRHCRQGVWQRPAMLDVSGSPLAILAPNHLADGMELTAALDMGFEQRHRYLKGLSRSSGPAGCHFAASLGRILEEV